MSMFKANFSVYTYQDKKVKCVMEMRRMRELVKDIYIIDEIGSANVFLLGKKDSYPYHQR
jgi:hypothetical protein